MPKNLTHSAVESGPPSPLADLSQTHVARPFLVPEPQRADAEANAWWAKRMAGMLLHRWHLLSLDAPTIATLWTMLIARSSGVALPATSLLAMFLAVWMLYAADRLLDARPLRALARGELGAVAAESGAGLLSGLEARHHFHHRHRWRFLAVLVGVGAALGLLLPSLPAAALRLYLLLGTMLVGYFVAIHVADDARLPKEIAVGLFFAAAVFIPTISARPDLRLQLLPVAGLFAAVCSLNCVAIYRWEHAEPRAGDAAGGAFRPPAHALTLWSVRQLTRLGAVVGCAALAMAMVPGGGRPECMAVALAGGLLLLLDAGRDRFSAVTLRALADLALATPLLLWLLHGAWVLLPGWWLPHGLAGR